MEGGNPLTSGEPVQRSRSFDYFDEEIEEEQLVHHDIMDPNPRTTSAEEELVNEEEAIRAVRSPTHVLHMVPSGPQISYVYM
jgi:hypothetical protein